MVEFGLPFSTTERPDLSRLIWRVRDIEPTVIETDVCVSARTICLVLSRVGKLCDLSTTEIFLSKEAAVIRPTLRCRAIPE